MVNLEVRFIYVHRIMVFNDMMSMRYTPLKTLFSGVDRILDMARTTVNVTGDAAGAVSVASSEKQLKTYSK